MLLEQTKKLKEFASLVIEKNKIHNLTAAQTTGFFLKTHIADCTEAYQKIESGLCNQVVDCGSGAGLPAIVWAIMNPNLMVFSVDSNQKKIAFQKHTRRLLGLKNLHPVAARVEDFELEGEATAVFKAFSSIKKGAQSLNKKNNFKNLYFFKKDDEKTKEEITEASALLYDYKKHEYTSNKEKMLIVELYDSKNSNH